MALPLLAIASLAVDHNLAQKKRTNLKNALDAAVLAAVTDQSAAEEERKASAVAHFAQNYEFANEFEVTPVIPTSDRLELSAKGAFPTLMSSVFGMDKIPMSEQSVAELTREKIICVMTLNPSGKRSFHITHGAEFNSSTCAVQVNSTHSEAAVVEKGAKATADDFCVSGGASGVFIPHVNTQCSQIEDPYKNFVAPESGPCLDASLKFGLKGNSKDIEIGDNVVMKPGTYCSKIHVKGQNVRMLPGTYIMDDKQFFVMQGASVTADDVTIVLRGKNSWMMIHHGSKINIKAPSEGPLAGMAIFQDASSITKGNDKNASAKTRLMGGAEMSIIGTVYVPRQSLEVKGGSSLDNTSPATSYIGFDISVSKDSYLSARVDHVAGDIPPILPRSDEGARLVD